MINFDFLADMLTFSAENKPVIYLEKFFMSYPNLTSVDLINIDKEFKPKKTEAIVEMCVDAGFFEFVFYLLNKKDEFFVNKATIIEILIKRKKVRWLCEIFKHFDELEINSPSCIRSLVRLNDICLLKNADKFGVDFNVNGGELLYIAAEQGSDEILEYLISKGADVHFEKDSPLGIAVKKNLLTTARLLLSYGACASSENNYALKMACENNSKDMLELLFSYGVRIESFSWSCLDNILNYSSFNTIEYLVDKTVDPYCLKVLRGFLSSCINK